MRSKKIRPDGYWPAYYQWYAMMDRCYNKNHKAFNLYGGRGIKVCDQWHDKQTFIAEFGLTRPTKKHSIDRINNDGNYEPSNVRWALSIDQMNNRNFCKKISAFGKSMTGTEWARETGLPYSTIWRRIQMGWEPEKAVSVPRRKLFYVKKPGRKPFKTTTINTGA